MNILLVDDDQSILLFLENILKKWGHKVITCDNGKDAWSILQTEKINIVLTDWVMPKLSGIDLCRRIRTELQLSHYIYIILLTGKSSNEDLITGFDSGADDFISKPVVTKELDVRINAAQRILKLELQLLQQNQKLEQANKKINHTYQLIKKDLDAAAKIQQTLLPKSNNTCLPVDLCWDFKPAAELAGDLFAFYPLDEQHLALYLIDVAGHGVPAAMLSVYLNKVLSAEQVSDNLIYQTDKDGKKDKFRQPAEIVKLLNQSYQPDNDEMLYLTMVFVIINTTTGDGTLCQAGHPYPLVARKNGQVDVLGKGGYPVGLIENASYTDISFHLDTGDRLLLYSDGITECFDNTDTPFGMQRLQSLWAKTSQQPLDKSIKTIIFSVEQWRQFRVGKDSFDDDISLLALELKKEVHHNIAYLEMMHE